MEHKEGNLAIIEAEDGYDQVVISIKKELDHLSPLSSECCIYRVPTKLCKINADAYTPCVISIGPFHRGAEALQAMEEHKLRYLNSFVCRNGRSLEDYAIFIRTREEKARSYYAENIKLSSDEFVEMILVDGCFLVELILRDYYGIGDDVDRIVKKPWLINQIERDLILLENQLPFFVLEDLFHFHQDHASNGHKDISFIQLGHEFFQNYTRMNEPPKINGDYKVKHFIDFLRLYYLPSSPTNWEYKEATIGIPPTITELHEAGVRFEKEESNCLVDVNFNKKKGVLKISHLEINDHTETLFRNLIAFEDCHSLEKYVTYYFRFINCLINTPKDVDLLIQNKIITNGLGSSEEVSTLFNHVCKEDGFGYSRLWKDLIDYRKTHEHWWKAIWSRWTRNYFDSLTRDYFDTPWKTVSIIAAVIFLALTFIQAVCSILSV